MIIAGTRIVGEQKVSNYKECYCHVNWNLKEI